VASTGPTPITAPDQFGGKPGDAGYLACPDASVITMTVSNAAIVWELGRGNPPLFTGSSADQVNQPPAYRSMSRRADAIRFRAAVPAAQLPVGQQQATVTIDTA
jgi:hypothetical protein